MGSARLTHITRISPEVLCVEYVSAGAQSLNSPETALNKTISADATTLDTRVNSTIRKFTFDQNGIKYSCQTPIRAIKKADPIANKTPISSILVSCGTRIAETPMLNADARQNTVAHKCHLLKVFLSSSQLKNILNTMLVLMSNEKTLPGSTFRLIFRKSVMINKSVPIPIY